jgi:hypothetical protein
LSESEQTDARRSVGYRGVRCRRIGETTGMSDQEKRPASESEETPRERPDGQEHGDSPPETETESLEERAHASTDAQWIAEGEEEGAS